MKTTNKKTNKSVKKCFAISAEFVKVEMIPDFYGVKQRTISQTILGYRYASDKEKAINSFMEDKKEKFAGYSVDPRDIATVEILPSS